MIEWQTLHSNMLGEIDTCLHKPLPEKELAEHAFKIPLHYWEEMKKKLTLHVFKRPSEEINFYKTIKPKFTSYIEYFPLVYLGLCYQPHSDNAVRTCFWIEEAKKLQKFIDKNLDFVRYYKSGSTDRDMQYFLPANYDLANYAVSKIYDMDGEYITSHDHLVAMLLANEMYNEYVNQKLITNN